MKEMLARFENPVFIKEMRVGFREKKVFYALVAWVLIVALIASLLTLAAFDQNRGLDNMAESGRYFLEGLFWVQLLLIGFLAPSLTTSAVSGERERKSFEMLLTTHLSPAELIAGKFGFAASFLFLAMFVTVPLESVVFFLGGVSLWSFVTSKSVIFSYALICALYGLMMSARESRSAYATGQTYLGIAICSFFGSFILGVVRYEDTVVALQIGIWVSLLYLGVFLFWKSVNHVEDRARHLVVLLYTGLFFYLSILGIAGFSSWYYPDFDGDLWMVSAPIHYFLFGLLLNPMRPTHRIEQQRFSKHLVSRPIFWVLVLTAGLLIPLSFSNSDDAIAICLYGWMAGLCTAWFVRGMAINKPERFPQLLGMTWLLLNVLPSFAAVGGFNADSHSFHPASISPIVMLVQYADHSATQFPTLAAIFYAGLFAVGQARHAAHRRKQAVSKKSPAA